MTFMDGPLAIKPCTFCILILLGFKMCRSKESATSLELKIVDQIKISIK